MTVVEGADGGQSLVAVAGFDRGVGAALPGVDPVVGPGDEIIGVGKEGDLVVGVGIVTDFRDLPGGGVPDIDAAISGGRGEPFAVGGKVD